jgi:F420-0:gamma-glutamyl ligase-like protein
MMTSDLPCTYKISKHIFGYVLAIVLDLEENLHTNLRHNEYITKKHRINKQRRHKWNTEPVALVVRDLESTF